MLCMSFYLDAVVVLNTVVSLVVLLIVVVVCSFYELVVFKGREIVIAFHGFGN